MTTRRPTRAMRAEKLTAANHCGDSRGPSRSSMRIGQGKPGPGRPRGIPNKFTRDLQAGFKCFVENNWDRVQELFDAVAKKDKAKALDLFLRLCEFAVPKLTRSEVRAAPPAVTDTPVVTAEQAAAVYREIIGNPDIDTDALVFGVPAQIEHAPGVESLPAPCSTADPELLTAADQTEAQARLDMWRRLSK